MNHIDDIERVVDLDQLYKMRGSFDNHSWDGFSIVIDDFYEKPDEVFSFLFDRENIPLWKMEQKHQAIAAMLPIIETKAT